MKKNKRLALRINKFKQELNKYKSGNLTDKEFSKLLLSEIDFVKKDVIEIYEAELKKDQKEIEILKSIKHKILNNIHLEQREKELLLTIIG
ncbi:hypothetical protein [Kordia sp.]|uniref:hypothetical protein n=1 Tax=Kordia sp. TaxID=1965332 RepID=UPI003B5C475A